MINKSRIHSLYLVIILVLTAILYSNSIQNGFVNWDDDISILNNIDIQSFDKGHLINMMNNSYNGMYQPVVMLTFAVNYAIHGLQPEGYHLTNLLFHLLNIVLLFVFVKIMFRNGSLAIVTALLFAIHPMHVESVSWITERKDVVYSFFYLLSLIMYLKYIQSEYQKKYLLITFFFFLLSSFSKTNAVTLPLIMIAIDVYFKRPVSRIVVFEKAIFLFFAFLFGLIAIKSQEVLTEGIFRNVHYSIIDRLFIACHAFVFYIVKFLAPFNLSALHPFPLKPDGFLPLHYYLSLLLLSGIVYGTIKLLLNKAIDSVWRNQIKFAVLFYMISISIVIFIPVGKADVADRYSYMPFIGLSIYFFLIIEKVTEKWFKHMKIILAVGFIVLFSFLTFKRNKIWKDSSTLWTDVIQKYPTSEVAYYGRAHHKLYLKDFSGALIDYNKAIDLNPKYTMAYINRGAVKLYLNDINGALIDLNKAILLDPKDQRAYFNRALVFLNLNLSASACDDFRKSAKFGNPEAIGLINKFCK